MAGIKDFGDTAVKLSKNPLGTIALFIVLVYGIAAVALGTTATSLDPIERKMIISFIILFPIGITGIFYNLVTKHHTKLYAPSDFKSEERFLQFTQQTAHTVEEVLIAELETKVDALGLEKKDEIISAARESANTSSLITDVIVRTLGTNDAWFAVKAILHLFGDDGFAPSDKVKKIIGDDGIEGLRKISVIQIEDDLGRVRMHPALLRYFRSSTNDFLSDRSMYERTYTGVT